MKTHLLPSRSFVPLGTSLLLLGTIHNWADCGPGTTTIAAVPSLGGSYYRVTALNASGDVAGLSYRPGDLELHAYKVDSNGTTDLGTLGGSASQAFALNNSGQVVGESTLAGDMTSHGFFHNGSTIVNVGGLGGEYSTAIAINDAGQIAGHSELLDNPTLVAFIYQAGSLTSLGHLGGEYSTAMSINQSGDIAGSSVTASGELHGFLYTGGTMIDLGSLGNGYSAAYAVNDAGAVVGDSALASGETRGFVYSSGLMINVGTLGGTSSSAYGINNAGQVIGTSTTPGDAQIGGFIYGSDITNLGTLGGVYTAPLAINDAGQVVGEAETSNAMLHAFLWQNGNMIDLNTLLPAGSGWELSSARFINNAGRIVGEGSLNGESRWYVLDLGSGNNPPVANAGEDQRVECGGPVTLNGNQSTDPDGDALRYEWSAGGIVLGTNSTIVASLSPGTHTITLRVSDPCGDSAQDSVTVEIVADTMPPTISFPGGVTGAGAGDCEAIVPDLRPLVVTSDNCTPVESLVVTQTPAAGTVLPKGEHAITVTVTDAAGNSASTFVTLKIADRTAPIIQSIAATPSILQPADNQKATVNVSVLATDNCDPAPVSKIVEVLCDERTERGDIEIQGDLAVKLIAARKSNGNGRTYTIVVECRDISGNAARNSVSVEVSKPGRNLATPKRRR